MPDKFDMQADARFRKVAVSWPRCLQTLQALKNQGIEVDRISIKGDFAEGDGVLVVLHAYTEQGQKVAFHNEDDPENLWVTLESRIRAGRLKWKEDEYAK